MKISNWVLVLGSAGGVLAPTGEALAEETSAGTLTGSVALVSDYVFRGLSQTDGDPALQAGIDYSHNSGWYFGAWGSNVSWLSDLDAPGLDISNSVEVDFYLGYRGAFSDALKFDVGVIEYYYPGDYPDGFVRPYTTEAYFGLSFGIVSAKYYHALTNLFGFADSEGSGYLDLAANYEFAPSWTLNAHAGRQHVDGDANDDLSYSDWKLGVTKAFSNGYSIAVAYVDSNADEALYTNPHGNYLGDSTGVVTLTKAF